MRIAPSAPTALALAAATLFAAGAVHPTALPPAARRGASPAAGVALVTAVLLRPRPGKKSKGERPESLRAVELPPVESHKQAKTKTQSAFSASRSEWDASPLPKTSDSEAADEKDESSSAAAAPSSTVYSYSYKSSKKRTKRNHSTEKSQGAATRDSQVEGLGGTFRHMREEFLTEPNSEYGNHDKAESKRATEEDWEDEWDLEDDDETSSWKEISNSVNRGNILDERDPPSPLSSAKLMQRAVRAPMWVLSELVLPTVDIVALLWFDCKVWLLRISERRVREGKERYFLPKLKRKRIAVEDTEYEEGLTDEELQIKQVQTATKNVVKGVEGTVRKLLNDIL